MPGAGKTRSRRTHALGERKGTPGTLRSALSLLVTVFDRYFLPVVCVLLPLYLMHFARILYLSWPDIDFVLQYIRWQSPIPSCIVLGFALTLFVLDLLAWKKDRSRRRLPFWHKSRPGIFDTNNPRNSTILLIGLVMGSVVLLVAWSISG